MRRSPCLKLRLTRNQRPEGAETSTLSSLFCASISFIFVSDTIPLIVSARILWTLSTWNIHPAHRHFQNICLAFPQIVKLDLKYQVCFLGNPHRRQSVVLHYVYTPVCYQIFWYIILLGNDKHFHLLTVFLIVLVELGEPWLPGARTGACCSYFPTHPL